MGDIKKNEKGDAKVSLFGLLVWAIVGLLLALFSFYAHRDWLDLAMIFIFAFLFWRVYLLGVRKVRGREEFNRIIAELALRLGSALTRLAV